MAIDHTPAGSIVNIVSASGGHSSGESATLIRAEHVQVFRMVMPSGKRTPEHRAAGAITIQCVAGEIELVAHGKTQRLQAGQLVFLADGEAHEVCALSDATLLISMWLHRK